VGEPWVPPRSVTLQGVTVFNKRNALLGFLTFQALKRRSRAKQLRRRAPKMIALFSLLGIAAVIGVVAVVLRRRGEDDFGGMIEDESEIVGEYVTASSEPIPAA
jgi:hypothetical protein